MLRELGVCKFVRVRIRAPRIITSTSARENWLHEFELISSVLPCSLALQLRFYRRPFECPLPTRCSAEVINTGMEVRRLNYALLFTDHKGDIPLVFFYSYGRQAFLRAGT